MYTCGLGYDGQLGHGNKEDLNSPAIVRALVGRHITQVQCGGYHTIALTSSGYVFKWGRAKDCLGHGKSKLECFSIPFLVEELREQNVVQITSGCPHWVVLVDPSPSPIRQLQEASFNNKQLADVLFVVENKLVFSNASILSQKCEYFAAMFRSNMRESIERVVNVPTWCSKALFLQLLEYLCLDNFTVRIDHALELWELADMYLLDGLKFCIMGALERGLCQENVSQILQEDKGFNCERDKLARMCSTFIDSKNEGNIYSRLLRRRHPN
jgi:hypothetical protein